MTHAATTDFTFVQLADFAAYEEVRASGRYNMFTPQARSAAGLSRDEYAFVMKNYSEIKAAAEADSAG